MAQGMNAKQKYCRVIRKEELIDEYTVIVEE